MGEHLPRDVAVLELRGRDLTLPQIDAIARGRRRLRMTEDPAVLGQMRAARDVVDRAVDDGQRIYGVTTGFGSMAAVPVEAELAGTSQTNLLSFLATAAGQPIDRRHVRAAMALRANMLLRGVSGVRPVVVERLIRFLNADAIPVVRELGSIGASGDLVPLATVARAVVGHASPTRVSVGDREITAAAALAELGLKPLSLQPKEALAMVNGTSFSAAVAANCITASRTLLAISLATHAMMLRALLGYEEPLLPFVHDCKPHPGQVWTARTLRRLLAEGRRQNNGDAKPEPRPHLQDAYSLRCSPQYLGPMVEGLGRVARVVEIEMNGVTDNPLVDAGTGRILQSGNFLGQYIGVAMDDLRRYLGLLAKHLDVQIAQLVAPEFNHGLPASLTGNAALSYNMGLKGLQITGNSIMPMLTHSGNPLVEHFPTHAEQFNQNINGLSWGSAHLAWRSVELFRHYASVALIFGVQALDLRARQRHGHDDGRVLIGPEVVPLYEAVYATLGQRPTKSAPLIFNDAEQSLEDGLRRLADNMDRDESLPAAVAPIVDSLATFDVEC